jgi:predicted negative regulator of RcsB-dependent stress response
MKNLRLILVGVLVSVAGFQTGQPVQAAAIDNGSFMSLWSTYSHCQATTDIDQLREDALTLTNAANRSLAQESFVLPLPGKLEQFVSTPAARFAVDVKAMAAACSLRAGSAAVEAGKVDVAKDLLQTVLSYQPQSEYAYYALQAKAMLSEIESNVVEVSLNLP